MTSQQSTSKKDMPKLPLWVLELLPFEAAQAQSQRPLDLLPKRVWKAKRKDTVLHAVENKEWDKASPTAIKRQQEQRGRCRQCGLEHKIRVLIQLWEPTQRLRERGLQKGREKERERGGSSAVAF